MEASVILTGKSKSNLIKFLAQDWHEQSLKAKLLIKVNCESKCFSVTGHTWSEVESLYSTQEEQTLACLKWAKVSSISSQERRGRVRTASSSLPLHAQSSCTLPGWSVAPCYWRVSQYPQTKWSWVMLWRWRTYKLLDDGIAYPRCHHIVLILQLHLRLWAA